MYNDFSSFRDSLSYITDKGSNIEWFHWLTSLGDSVIVREFEVESGRSDQSRTGSKIMVKGGGWRVPPLHSGKEGNNFITRATNQILPELESFILKTVRSSA